MQGFKDVAGHEEIIAHLQNAVKMNKVSHAYIFGGEHGSGKKLLASLFAMTLQCETQGIEPCMQCTSCKKALSKNHPDIINITHEKPNSIGIEEIRQQLMFFASTFSSKMQIDFLKVAWGISPVLHFLCRHSFRCRRGAVAGIQSLLVTDM